MIADPNGNHDSGYVASNVEETTIMVGTQTPAGSPRYAAQTIVNNTAAATAQNASATATADQRGNGFDGGAARKEPLR